MSKLDLEKNEDKWINKWMNELKICAAYILIVFIYLSIVHSVSLNVSHMKMSSRVALHNFLKEKEKKEKPSPHWYIFISFLLSQG